MSLQPVFETMLANATRLCEAQFGVLNLYDGERLSLRCHAQRATCVCRIAQARTVPISIREARTLASLPTKEVAHFVDCEGGRSGYLARDPFVVAAVELGGVRTLVVVPMLKENELIGAIRIYRQEVRPFTDKQIELVSNFAKQAVIAIENTRLLNELRRDRPASSRRRRPRFLSVISSSPGELEPVFNKMLENATRVCNAEFGTMVLQEKGGFRHVALYNMPPPSLNWLAAIRSSIRRLTPPYNGSHEQNNPFT